MRSFLFRPTGNFRLLLNYLGLFGGFLSGGHAFFKKRTCGPLGELARHSSPFGGGSCTSLHDAQWQATTRRMKFLLRVHPACSYNVGRIRRTCRSSQLKQREIKVSEAAGLGPTAGRLCVSYLQDHIDNVRLFSRMFRPRNSQEGC